jgi:glycosyltransferase involved in cell wall biosynthesis
MRRDIAVEACSKLGLLLRVVGRGPEHENLRALAGHTVEFYTDLDDQEVAEALHNAEALISCGIEDFGITAVEALSAGCSVIALAGGGADEIVTEGKTGMFFKEQTTESLVETLKQFSPAEFSNAKSIAKSAQKFSSEVFRGKIYGLIDQCKMTTEK